MVSRHFHPLWVPDGALVAFAKMGTPPHFPCGRCEGFRHGWKMGRRPHFCGFKSEVSSLLTGLKTR